MVRYPLVFFKSTRRNALHTPEGGPLLCSAIEERHEHTKIQANVQMDNSLDMVNSNGREKKPEKWRKGQRWFVAAECESGKGKKTDLTCEFLGVYFTRRRDERKEGAAHIDKEKNILALSLSPTQAHLETSQQVK